MTTEGSKAVEIGSGAGDASLESEVVTATSRCPGTLIAAAQMSLHLAAPPPTEGLLHDLLYPDLSAGALAARAGVSERHLARLFLSELGQTPGRYVPSRPCRSRGRAARHDDVADAPSRLA